MTENRPVIVTTIVDREAQDFFNHMREKHFPKDRNYIPAHITLFHKIPAAKLPAIKKKVAETCLRSYPFKAEISGIMFLGFGSAYKVSSEKLGNIRHELYTEFEEDLDRQDKNKFTPHITFQNKVPADKAKETNSTIKENFEPFLFEIQGIKLWFYDGGPWQEIEDGEYYFLEKENI